MLHEPVMVAEVLEHLAPSRGGVFVDCTVGLGGHARALLEAGASQLIGLDRDRDALEKARETLKPFGDRASLVHGDYRNLADVLNARGTGQVDGVLADLGVSSMQLDAPGRGFSFRRDEPLDMRMDQSSGATAADMLATADERALADVIYELGEERHARRVARAIVEAGRTKRIETTGRLAEIVRRAIPRKGYSRIDPATRTFQAIRIWVNRELDGLDGFLTRAAERLAPEGRLVVITFHSLEDRVVKHTLRALQTAGAITIRTKRPQVPTEAEIERNPRARSAKLRAAAREQQAVRT
ncbi:MAG TPA: 16S rRNA (cytosine(1402)-N(4))-methyltransferase RsmH [Vicinamibacterales bacterium]|nr:16S rRNA (cytosine(1402)-N(4))-methyltransferase RsmH [Vicinamibacterales bacterium]